MNRHTSYLAAFIALASARAPLGVRDNADPPEKKDEKPEAQPSWAEFEKRMDEKINGALKSHTSRIEKKLGEQLTEQLGGFSTKLEAFLSQKPEAAKDGKPADAAKPADAKAADPEKEALLKRLAELEEKSKVDAEARKAEKARADAKEEREALANELRAQKTQEHLVGPLVALLHGENKRVLRAKDGKIVFKSDDDELVSLDEGIKAYLGTDAGKAYVEPRGAGGSGQTKKNGGEPPSKPSNSSSQSKEELNQNLLEAFRSGGFGFG